jgi:hypothetical protein
MLISFLSTTGIEFQVSISVRVRPQAVQYELLDKAKLAQLPIQGLSASDS